MGSVRDLVDVTQSRFWAVNVGPPPPYDPMTETEYLVERSLAEAEADGTLRYAASTYDADSDRLVAGTGRPGPRVLDFAPILAWNELPLVPALRKLLAVCEEELGAPVEIEFAVSLPPGQPARFGFLQVRPLLVSREAVEVSAEDLASPLAVVASSASMGNGRHEVRDVVYVEPEAFEARLTPAIASEIEPLNRALVDGRPPLPAGRLRPVGLDRPLARHPGALGPDLGARGIVEATLPQMNPEPSQGSHFFHNLSSFSVLYFTVPFDTGRAVDWGWLAGQEVVARTEHVRHVRTRSPLVLRVDGRSRAGWRPEDLRAE